MNEKDKFEWIKTSKCHPRPHQLILFVDKYDNIHYGVLCSEMSHRGRKNKYWCHIFQQVLNKKDVSLWSYIPQWEIYEKLYPHYNQRKEYGELENRFHNIRMNIEKEILDDAKKNDYEKYPGVLVRNALHRYSCEIFQRSRNGKRED